MAISETQADIAMEMGLTIIVLNADGKTVEGRLTKRKRFKGARTPFYWFEWNGHGGHWVHPNDIKRIKERKEGK